MTTAAVPDTSSRGCPSSHAGTTLQQLAALIPPYALTSTIWCRADRSGFIVDTTHAAHSYDPSATAYSYAALPTPLTQRRPNSSQHAAILSPAPFAGLPIGDKGAFTALTVSAPNRPEGDNLLQNSDSLSAAPMPMPVAGFARHGRPDAGDVSPFSASTGLWNGPWSAVEGWASDGV